MNDVVDAFEQLIDASPSSLLHCAKRSSGGGGRAIVPLVDDRGTLAFGPVASEFGPSLQTLVPDDEE